MAKPLGYLASVGLVCASDKLLGAATQTATLQETSGLIRRQLGRTGLMLPIVSMGATAGPGLVIRAYELGVRHFDTAAKYGRGQNEEMLGKAIKPLGARDKVVIATRVIIPPQLFEGPNPELVKEQLLKGAETCLQRLQMDYVDIFSLHEPGSPAEINHPGALEALRLLKAQGKARYVGFSTHRGQVDMLKAAANGGFYDVVLMAFNYTMSEKTPLLDAMKLAVSKGIGLIAMKTQAGGTGPSGPVYREQILKEDVRPPVNHLAVLKWALRHETITTAIPGIGDYAHLEEDFSVASNLELTDKEKKYLADENLKARLEFCQQCGECVPSCPQHVEIPALMRTHMYALNYGNTDQARETLAGVPAERGLDACRTCTRCHAACVNTVNIARKINELKTIQFG